MEIQSYVYEVMYIHNALQEWSAHSFISLLNEVGLLSLMNDKKSCSLGEVGFNYFQKQVSWK